MRRLWLLTAVLVGAVALGCGGGEEATPQPAATATPRPAATTAPQPTAAPRPTATPQPAATSTPVPASTPQPRPTPTVAAAQRVPRVIMALENFGTEDTDPITSSSLAFAIFGVQTYDFAVWHNKDGSLAPGVLERWEQAADGLSWSVTIRDMKFHNGDPVTAEDVKFNFERILTPAATGAGNLVFKNSLANVDVLSPRAAVLHLKQPWPLFPFNITVAEGSLGAIYSKTAFERAPNAKAFFDRPVGTGPFRIVEHRFGQIFRYEASEQKHPYRQQPAFQELHLLFVPEESTRVAMLRTGAADVAAVSSENVGRLQQSGFTILRVDNVIAVRLHFFGLDIPEQLRAVPTGDVRVRRALHTAIDRQELVNTLLGGFATIHPREMVIPGTEGFDPSWKPTPYDPGEARRLLAQAGYASGLTVRLHNPPIPGASWTVRAGEAVAGYWGAVGVKTDIIPIEYGAWRPIFTERPHLRALGAFGWVPLSFSPNGLRWFESGYHSKGAIHALADLNIDAIIERAGATRDPGERSRLIREMSNTIFDLYGNILIAYVPALYAAAPKIAGWDAIAIGGAGLSWETLRFK